MLFLVSHANETDYGSYSIKHIYLHASSLLHAHVYITLFGYKISPEFYDLEEDGNGPTQDDVNRCLNQSIEYFEKSNRDCSYGEHYWHSIKEISNINNQYPLKLHNDENKKSIFKLIIQSNYPCSKHSTDDNITYYDIEQNTNIYQFDAININNVIQYIFTHIQDYDGLIEFCQQVNQKPEELAESDWQNIDQLCKTNLKECIHSFEDCQKQRKINLYYEELSEPIPVFHSDI